MKLVFEGNGGYDFERKSAREKLVVGRKYAVEKIKVGSWNTEVYLQGYKDSFNSCLFQRDDYLEGLIYGDKVSDGSFELVKSYFIFNILPKD